MTAATLQENKMGVMSVGKLIANMALPMVISMLVQALYNLVDSIYVSQVSESAVTALSLAFPVQNLQIGFAVGVGVGVNAMLSQSLGSNVAGSMDYDRERVEKALCEFDCVETDRDFSRAGNIFCLRDGVRTELALCS